MSQTVHFVGKLKKVDLPGTLEDQCKQLCKNYMVKVKREKYVETWREQLDEVCGGKYACINNILFSVEMTEIDPDDEIILMHENSDGTYSFELKYYNGGCCFVEALTEAFDRLKS